MNAYTRATIKALQLSLKVERALTDVSECLRAELRRSYLAERRKRDLLRKWRAENSSGRTGDRLCLRLHWSINQCGTIAAAAGKLPGPGVRMLAILFKRAAFANSNGRRMSEPVLIAGPKGVLP